MCAVMVECVCVGVGVCIDGGVCVWVCALMVVCVGVCSDVLAEGPWRYGNCGTGGIACLSFVNVLILSLLNILCD